MVEARVEVEIEYFLLARLIVKKMDITQLGKKFKRASEPESTHEIWVRTPSASLFDFTNLNLSSPSRTMHAPPFYLPFIPQASVLSPFSLRY